MLKRVINPNLLHLFNTFRKGEKSGAVLEGSSRSGKTWSSVDFIIWYCSTIRTDATINIIKETYKSFKTTLYEDFNRRLPMYGISSPFADRQEVASFKLFGNTINLLGADSETTIQGVGSDLFYINESLEIPKAIFDQFEQRCRGFFWLDYNPKVVDHWIYNNVCKRPDIAFLKTTFLDNPFISKQEKRKILSYEPWHPDDRELPVEERRDHPINIEAGTSDEFMWNVYGLGMRTAMKGLIFPNVTWIKEWPSHIDVIGYGSDIGYTNSPSTIVQGGVDHNLRPGQKKKDLYLKLNFYSPTPAPSDYVEAQLMHTDRSLGVVNDSADPIYTSKCRQAGILAYLTKKFAGSVKAGISLLKEYNIHIVDSPHWRVEQSGYKYREIHGIATEEPIDDFNHAWDAARYFALFFLKNES